MDLLQLRYFCLLAEKQHLSNTAKDLMISPPSLSLTITKLESELGVPLFDRVKRNIYLNTYGKTFYDKVKPALELLDSSVSDLNALRTMNEHTIHIATTSPLLWQDLFDKYSQLHPDITFDVTKILPAQLNEDSFPYDFIIGNGRSITSPNRNIVQIRNAEQHLLIISNKHPLAGRSMVTVEEIKNETFITLGDTNITTVDVLHDLFACYGIHEYKTVSADFFTRLLQLKKNKGVVLTTDLGYDKQFINDGSLQQILIDDSKSRKRYQTISWKKAPPSPLPLKHSWHMCCKTKTNSKKYSF